MIVTLYGIFYKDMFLLYPGEIPIKCTFESENPSTFLGWRSLRVEKIDSHQPLIPSNLIVTEYIRTILDYK